MPEDIGQIAQMGMAPPPQQAPQQPDQLQEMIKKMQNQVGGMHTQVVPPPVTNKAAHGSLGMNIATSALAGMVPFVGSAVQKAIKEQRESQINQAMNTYASINAELEMAEAVSGGDEQKKKDYLDKSPLLKAIFADKKVAKNIQKVFDKDLMSPEKQNTVYHEGLARFMKLKGAGNKLKQVHGMLAKHQESSAQGQPSPQQPQQNGAQPQQGQQPQQPQGQQPQQPSNSSIIDKMPQKMTQPSPHLTAALTALQHGDNQAAMEAIRKIEEERKIERDQQLQAKEQAKQQQDAQKAAEEKRHHEATEAQAARNLTERQKEYTNTDQFKRWKEKLDIDTKIRMMMFRQTQAPAQIVTTATFARSGEKALSEATDIMRQLDKSGAVGGPLQNKMENYLFGKGLIDPSLPKKTRYQIGQLRSKLTLADSALLKAHTGRTSHEIFVEFKDMLGMGQGLDAFYGAADAASGMLNEYGNAATPEAMANLKTFKGKNSSTPDKVHSISELPDAK